MSELINIGGGEVKRTSDKAACMKLDQMEDDIWVPYSASNITKDEAESGGRLNDIEIEDWLVEKKGLQAVGE